MSHPHAHDTRATHLLLPFAVGPAAAPGLPVFAGDVWVAGWIISEATGAATATCQVMDGNDANGRPAGPLVTLAANGVQTVMLGGHLLTLQTGVFLRVTAGSVNAVFFVADRDAPERA